MLFQKDALKAAPIPDEEPPLSDTKREHDEVDGEECESSILRISLNSDQKLL